MNLRRLVLALGIGAVTFSMANGVDRGVTRSWPDWARALWVLALLVGIFATVFLFLNSIGVLTDEVVREAGDVSSAHAGRLGLAAFLTIYVAVLAFGVGAAILAERVYGVHSTRTILIVIGALFVVSSSGRPWWLYETVRRVNWFGAIPSDRVMKVILILIGTACVLVGVFAKA